LLSQKAVIVGIGNDMRGDDAFGPMVVERLRGRVRADLIDAGVSPENCLGKLSALKPRVVLLVDAVDFDGAPGDMALLDPAKLETTSFNGTSRRPTNRDAVDMGRSGVVVELW
jgi:hydrogenase 3 maturation protease